MLWRKLVRTLVGEMCDYHFDMLCFPSCYTFIYVLTDVKKKWESSSWGRKLIVQKRRAALTDFDRFKLMLAKIKVCYNMIFHTFKNLFRSST